PLCFVFCCFELLLLKIHYGFCQPEWHLYDDACFKVFRSSTSWDKAQMECQITGGYLASIHSLAQHDFFLIGPNFLAKLWIGLSDANKDRDFVWTDNDPLVYSNWAEGEPSYLTVYGREERDGVGNTWDTRWTLQGLSGRKAGKLKEVGLGWMNRGRKHRGFGSRKIRGGGEQLF
uniref:C-type lectin domain-containing protein n=1 Tax=Eptatretus burgeri TaxID=7764 RepID=A0A8C4Q2Q7_EPTBU